MSFPYHLFQCPLHIGEEILEEAVNVGKIYVSSLSESVGDGPSGDGYRKAPPGRPHQAE